MARLSIVCAACSVALAGAQERPTFRSAANTVYIYATVQGPDGRLVTDLTRDDFDVFDDNRRQPITTFDNSPQTITLAVMFDMSRSLSKKYARIRDGATALVNALWETDRARIGSFGQEVAISPLLTGDKPTLLRIVDEELWPGTVTPLWNAAEVAMTSLEAEAGRRVVLLFTDGDDSGLFVPGSRGKARAMALRGAFMLYAVGLKGSGLNDELLSIVDDSGGGHYLVRDDDDLGETFAGIVNELHHQYVIGFAMAAIDGRTHKLTLRTRRPGTKVRARSSYVASSNPAGAR